MKKVHISQADTLFANGIYPIEFILFYREKLDTEKIRGALKELASLFWPMFGKYDGGIISFDEYSESESFNEIILHEDFNNDEAHLDIYKKYHNVNPANMNRLSFLTVIQFKNGTAIIPKLSHLAGDGYSYFFFLSALASKMQGSEITFRPKHERTVLKDFKYNHNNTVPIPGNSNLLIENINVPREEVHVNIRKIKADFGETVSTNDILTAMMMKKSVEVEKATLGEDFFLTIPIDVRNKVSEYGPVFFGNGIMKHVTEFKTEEIEGMHINEIAVKIRKFMPEVTSKSYYDFLESLEGIIEAGRFNELEVYDPEKGCLVTNLSRLPASILDFGSGNPDFIFALTIAKNSAAVLADEENYILRMVY
ncbi:acyltransferase [Spirochaetota bacterium]